MIPAPRVVGTPIIVVVIVIMPSRVVDGLDSNPDSRAVGMRVTTGVQNRQTRKQNQIKAQHDFFHLIPAIPADGSSVAFFHSMLALLEQSTCQSSRWIFPVFPK